MKPVVRDNFLPYDAHLGIENTLCGYGFPWYFNNTVIYRDGVNSDVADHFQFTHIFYMSGRPSSDYFPLVEPLVERLNVRSLIRMKANLVTRTPEIIEHGMHTDIEYSDAKTAVYYVNSNDGYTRFKTGDTIQSVANRIVTFPSSLEHSGSSCTDQKTRVVININYF